MVFFDLTRYFNRDWFATVTAVAHSTIWTVILFHRHIFHTLYR